MIKISRRKDLTDFFAIYKYSINNKQKNIKAGETITIDLNEKISFFQVQFLYFKSQKILLHKEVDTTIKIGSCIDNKLIFFVMPFALLSLFLASFTDLDWPLFYEISKYLALFYFLVLIYFSTFGYKKYLHVEMKYQKL